MIEHTFAAMGCEIIVRGGSASNRVAIERLFATREQVFSRFIADSELNRVNARAGRPQLVSAIFADTLRVALDAATETGGLVVPTVGTAIEAVGYTRDSSRLAPDPGPGCSCPRGRGGLRIRPCRRSVAWDEARSERGGEGAGRR